MRISEVSTYLYKLPPHRPIVDAIQEFRFMEAICIRVRADGKEGFGLTYTIGRGGQAVKNLLDSEFVPRLLGEDALDTERIWEKFWHELHWIGRQGIFSLALSAVDIALWDLKAVALNQPLYELLGAGRKAMPTYNTDVGWLNHSKDQLVQEVQRAVEQGFQAVKVKVGKAERWEDIERLEAVRQVLGSRRRLMVDANMRWTAAEAIARADAFEEFDIYWLEEPIEADDVYGHEQLARHTTIPVAIGESLYNRYAFKEYALRGAAAILQPDVARVGGITEWLRIARMAHSLGLSIAPHFLMELHIHLACATPNALFVEYIPFLERFVEKPLELKDGLLHAPDVEGHGLRFNEKATEYLLEQSDFEA